MKAFRIKTDKVVHPFDEAARDLYVATKPIRQWQEDACAACGLNLIEIHDLAQLPDEPGIVFFDDVFFTEMALRHFTADAMTVDEDIALAMPNSHAARAIEPAGQVNRGDDGSFIFDIFALNSGRRFSSRGELQKVCVVWTI